MVLCMEPTLRREREWGAVCAEYSNFLKTAHLLLQLLFYFGKQYRPRKTQECELRSVWENNQIEHLTVVIKTIIGGN